MPTPRELLLQMLAEQSFHLGEFKLSSGGSSDYYIDCRATTLSGEGARLVGRVFYEEIYNSGTQPEAVGGLTLGADPIVTAVAMLSAQHIQGRATERPGGIGEYFKLDGFLVRKADKTHGMQQRIEGFRKKGAKVFINPEQGAHAQGTPANPADLSPTDPDRDSCPRTAASSSACRTSATYRRSP